MTAIDGVKSQILVFLTACVNKSVTNGLTLFLLCICSMKGIARHHWMISTGGGQ